MTTPESTPQPRDIALEQVTPELAADLEAQSDGPENDGPQSEPDPDAHEPAAE